MSGKTIKRNAKKLSLALLVASTLVASVLIASGYGKTKHGKYMLEPHALTAGYKPAK
jgi:hypothetical protein